MRKILLVLAMGLVVMACNKDSLDPNDPNNPNNPNPTDPLEVLRVQNAFGVNFSGTWCGPCGANGIPALYNVATTHGDKFHGIKVGLNGSGAPDPFYVGDGSDLANLYYPPGGRGIPGFGAGATFYQGHTDFTDAINTIIATPASAVKAGVAATSQVKGDSLIINVRFRAFEALPSGLYTLGVLVVEDDLVASQAGQSTNPFTHKMVFRGAAYVPGKPAYGALGHAIQELGAIAAGTVVEMRFGYLKPTGMSPAVTLSKCKAIAVITKMNTSNFKPDEIINSVRTR